MSTKFKIINKKNIHDGFFKMNEVTLKYQKYDGSWTNNIKRELFGGAQVAQFCMILLKRNCSYSAIQTWYNF